MSDCIPRETMDVLLRGTLDTKGESFCAFHPVVVSWHVLSYGSLFYKWKPDDMQLELINILWEGIWITQGDDFIYK